ncbi:cytochrome P450 [Mycena galericulata]|nr:cytochrome P450 [Mycena galericulata]
MSNIIGFGLNYATAAASLVAILALYVLVRRPSSIRNIAGPPSPSWIFGNMLQLLLPERYGDYEFRWQKLYGSAYRLKGCFGEDRLIVSDPLALQSIKDSPHFKYTSIVDNMLFLMNSNSSVIVAQGQAHKRLRAAMNPGFTAAAVRKYQHLFESAADMIAQQLENSSTSTINISPLFSVTALNAASEAVLGYSTQDLGEEYVWNNGRVVALSSNPSPAQFIADAICGRLPAWVLRAAIRLPTSAFKTLRSAKYLAEQVGRRVVREKKEAAQQGLEMDDDIYTLFLNPDDTSKALSEEEVVAQTAILLLAGQDTTANTMALGLLELASHPDFQNQLRAEIHSTLGGSHSDVAYDNMPLLNAFIKEVLRMYPAGALADRVAVSDTIIPLRESIVTSTGERITAIPVRKGQIVTSATASNHRLESLWGADAHEFKPSRWVEGVPYKGDAYGPYANLLAFGSGTHTCIGILEMQVILCELVRKFSFALPEGGSIRTRFATTLMPIDSAGEKGARLCITRIV